MNTQPIWTTNTIVAFVSAIIALAVAFGLNLSADQKVAIVGAVSFIAPFIAAALSNSRVTPLVSPTDEDGTPLVRAGTQSPTLAHTRALRRGQRTE